MKDQTIEGYTSVKCIDTIRLGGNVAAHGGYSSSSGELIDLDLEEAERLFEIVEKFYYDLEIDLPRSQALTASILSKSKNSLPYARHQTHP